MPPGNCRNIAVVLKRIAGVRFVVIKLLVKNDITCRIQIRGVDTGKPVSNIIVIGSCRNGSTLNPSFA